MRARRHRRSRRPPRAPRDRAAPGEPQRRHRSSWARTGCSASAPATVARRATPAPVTRPRATASRSTPCSASCCASIRRRSGGRQYSIPPDNPFASGGGRPEIWAYGLAQPVEVLVRRGDRCPRGSATSARTRSRRSTGSRRTPSRRSTSAGRVGRATTSSEATTRPAPSDRSWSTPTTAAARVSGGFVYRGTKIPDLVGTYLYSDFCDGTIRGTPVGAGVVGEEINFGVEAADVTGFGQDHDREVYVLSQRDGLLRIDPV